MQNKIQILCTKTISSSFIELAEENNMAIDQMNFIETKDSVSEEIKKRITQLSNQNITVIFTSSNAVNAVGKINSGNANWKIYCIEPATKKTIQAIFKNSSIIDSAQNAEELSKKIIANESVKQAIFFCGNQRRDLLPERLKSNRIKVEEIIVYQTVETPKVISKKYDGILFFSPSAVKSFFSKNKSHAGTILFSIGKTTADEVKNFSKNRSIVSNIPDTQKLITEAINYFSAIKNIK